MLDFISVMAVSIFIGFLIGIEREIRKKPVGLKTLTLIILSSSTLIYFSRDLDSSSQSRIIQGLLTCYGFIGAGSVIHYSKKFTLGLTTGALVVFSSIIGILIGRKNFLEAIIISLFILFILTTEGFLEKKFLRKKR